MRLRTTSGIQETFHYVLRSHREVTAAQGFSHSEHSGLGEQEGSDLTSTQQLATDS